MLADVTTAVAVVDMDASDAAVREALFVDSLVAVAESELVIAAFTVLLDVLTPFVEAALVALTETARVACELDETLVSEARDAEEAESESKGAADVLSIVELESAAVCVEIAEVLTRAVLALELAALVVVADS